MTFAAEPPVRSAPTGGQAAEPTVAERTTTELTHELMSPYCPGRTIASCTSAQARKLEDEILEQARAGRTREEIEHDLVARFGPEIVGYAGRPELVWGTLAVAVVVAWLLFRAGRRWAAREQRPAADTQPPSARERDSVEDALDRLDEF